MKLPILTLRALLFLLVGVAVTPLLAFFLYTRHQVRKMAAAEWKEEVLRLVEEAAGEHTRVLEESRQFLEVLARTPGVRSMDPRACSDPIAPIAGERPYYTAVGLVGPDLYAVCTDPAATEARLGQAEGTQTGRLYLGDREYIRRAVEERRFSTSRYHQGRLSGRGAVSMAQPILGADSTVLGVLAVGVGVAEVHRLFVRLPPIATVTIFDRGGTVILREPGSGGWPERTLPDTVLRTLVDTPGPMERIGLDGEPRLVATAPIGRLGDQEPAGYLTIELDPRGVTVEASRALRANVIAVLLAGLLLLAGVWGTVEFAFLRRLGPVIRASERLGRGDLDARSGIEYGDDEVGRLAATFDRMADNLRELREEEKRQARLEIREREERLQQLVQAIDEVFWLWDAETGSTIFASPAFEKIWGRSSEEVLADQESWLACIHPEDREAERRQHPPSLVESVEREYRIVRPDGAIRWILDRSFPLRDAEGKVYRVAGLAKDVTEEKEWEKAIQRSQKLEALGRLAGGVAHEFNNLLTAVRGHAQLLLADLDDGSELRRDAEEIDDAARRAAGMTSQLLAFGRKLPLRPVLLDLNHTVEEMQRLLIRLIDEDVEVVSHLGPGLDRVRADPGSMEQVVMNLVVNARDAMPEGGSLAIETDMVDVDPETAQKQGENVEPGRYVRLSVSDTGGGMTPDVMARIFDPFFTTKKSGGTGLGLATVYGTVHQSGGFVTVESIPDQGSVFRVHLPSAGPGADGRGAVREAPRPMEGDETVLVVEDEDAVRSVARRALTRFGYTVLEAEDGQAGLEVFDAHEEGIDLVLTDVVMPRLNGPGLVRKLQERRPDLKILYMSGYPGESQKGGAALSQGSNFLPKPFSATSLVEAVRDVLDGLR